MPIAAGVSCRDDMVVPEDGAEGVVAGVLLAYGHRLAGVADKHGEVAPFAVAGLRVANVLKQAVHVFLTVAARVSMQEVAGRVIKIKRKQRIETHVYGRAPLLYTQLPIAGHA